MQDRREKALKLLGQMLGTDMTAAIAGERRGTGFAERLGPLAMNGVFEPLWTGDTLDPRTRSLITIAMLIALRAHEELEIHFPAAIRNGATIAELEEVIYQASGYAGFPAANSARIVAERSLAKAGFLGTDPQKKD